MSLTALVVLLLILVVFGGIGAAVHVLWWIGIALLILWAAGFLLGAAEGGRRRWYRW